MQMTGKIFRYFLRIVVWFIAISVISVIFFRFIPIPITPLMIIRCIEQNSDNKEIKLKKKWVSLNEISSAMPLAAIAAEDQKFEEHSGFDLEAIKKAENYNEKHHGKKVKGASTISQQTAKNLFLWPNRSWVRKGFEVYFTFLIEIFWSKRRIMEVYLNIIEMGDGIYGVDAAAQTYFHKPASKLSVQESALIAAILPSPLKWSPVKPNPRVQKKANRIVHFISQLKFADF